MNDDPSAPEQGRWQSRPVLAGFLRALIFAGPLVAGFIGGRIVAGWLPEPDGMTQIIGWWAVVIAAATGTATIADWLARKLLPITVMLKMTMLFPDQAPSRVRVARRVGNIGELRRQIIAARHGGDATAGDTAELILALSSALSRHDRATRGHSERTRTYTELLAEELGLSETDRAKLRWAALLHDVGKLEIDPEILNKSGELTDDEYEAVKQHPIHGMNLCAPLLPWLGDWALAIEHHHERYDGTGYPHGLKGNEISFAARIVTVADAYDVMTSGRSYQAARSPSEARQEIASLAGIQFDPLVARALMNLSLGRLRSSMGPWAIIGQLPLLRGIPNFLRDVSTIAVTSAVVTASIATGVIEGAPFSSVAAAISPDVVVAAEDPTVEDPSMQNPPAATDDGDTSSNPDDLPPLGDDGGDESTTTTTLPSTTTTTDPETATTGSTLAVANDSATTDEDSPATIDVLQNDGGDPLSSTLAISSAPSHGSASVASGRVRYTPDQDYNGSDSFVYRVCDATGACQTGSVSMTIRPVNDAPVTPNRVATVDQGKQIQVTLGYSDPEGDSLRCTMTGPPAHGAASVPTDCAQLTFQAPTNHAGTVTVEVTASDGQATSRGTIQITVNDANFAPTAVDDTASSTGGQVTVDVIANDSDPDGDALSIASVSSVSSGTASISNNRVVYSPPNGFAGTATLTYTVCDPSGACDSATVTITVTQPNPVNAVDDSISVGSGGQITFKPTTNDTGPLDLSTLTIISEPSHGTISKSGSSGNLRFRADNNYTGSDSFRYRICDGAGNCDTATVFIEIG